MNNNKINCYTDLSLILERNNIEKKEINGVNFLRSLIEPFIFICDIDLSSKKIYFDKHYEYMYVVIEEDESEYYATFKPCSYKEETKHIFKGDVNKAKEFLLPRFNKCIKKVIHIFLLCQKNKFFPKIIQNIFSLIRKKINEFIMQDYEIFLNAIKKLKYECIKYVNENTKNFVNKNDIHYFIDPNDKKTITVDFKEAFENVIQNVLYGDFYISDKVVLTNCQGFTQIVNNPITPQFENILENVKELYPEKTNNIKTTKKFIPERQTDIYNLPIIIIKYIMALPTTTDRSRLNFLSTCKRFNVLKNKVIFNGQVKLEKIINLPYYDQFTNIIATGSAITLAKNILNNNPQKTLLPLKLKKLVLNKLERISLNRLTRGLELTHLVISKTCKKMSINKAAFPKTLKFLTWELDSLLKFDFLPDSLEALKVDYYYSSQIVLPKNLKHLDLGKNFHGDWISPPQLKRLIVDVNFNPGDVFLPETLERVTIGKNCNLNKNDFNNSVTVVKWINGKYQFL